MALFIGGQADGRRMRINHPERVMRLPYIRPLSISVSSNEEIIGEMQVETYYLTYNDIYIHESLEKKDLIKLLANGYRHEDEAK